MFGNDKKREKPVAEDILHKGLSTLKTEYFLKEALLASNRLSIQINSMLLEDNFMPAKPVDVKNIANDLNLLKNITETLYDSSITDVYSKNYKIVLNSKVKILSAKHDLEELREYILGRLAPKYVILIGDTYDTAVEAVEMKIYERISEKTNNLLGIVKYYFLLDKMTLQTKDHIREIDFEDLNTGENLNQQLYRIIRTEINAQQK